MIKVCGDPGCGAIWHNIPKQVTKCSDCNGTVKSINESTYQKKFSNNWFQYDYTTGEYHRPLQSKHTNTND